MNIQGMDGFARNPALIQDTQKMVEKNYHLTSYCDHFGAYLMTYWPIKVFP